jgi:sugar lactone lactonase YvrE
MLGLCLAAVVAYLLAWPIGARPRAWDAPEAPSIDSGVYARNDRLRGIERIAREGRTGPEYVEVDGAGRVYAGWADGWIVRYAADGSDPHPVANTGGRPLGMRVLGDSALVVADGRRGLLHVDPRGGVRVLADSFAGARLGLVDDVAVTADGRFAYFSDATTRFGLGEYVADLVEHGGHGRLFRLDLATGRLTLLMRGLQFANGVAMGPGDRYLLVAETGAYRVWRYWLQGPRAGRAEPFVENLPGFPDNVTFNGADRVWVAIAAPRNALVDRLDGRPFLRAALLRLPQWARPRPAHHAFALAFDTTGRVAANLQFDHADAYAPITTVQEAGPWLYFGSLAEPAIGRLRRPD